MKRIARTGVLLFILVFVVSACGSYVHISEISDSPQEYKGRQISVKGRVIETVEIPLVHKGLYRMDDGTGKIWIVPQGRVPFRGEKVKVKGQVKTGFTILKRTFGTVIVEEEEK
jgi:hypothetical protein